MKFISFAAVFITLTLAGCVSNPVFQPSASGEVTVNTERARVSIAFSDSDRVAISDYYRGRHSSKKVPPGLAKRHAPPPGHKKQLVRNGALPPGLQGRALPSDLESRLTDLPEGYVRLRIESDIVILNEKTRVVVDVIKDVS